MNLKKLNELYKIMESSLTDGDKPCVGIFWYSPARKECFGVVKSKEGDSNYIKGTCKELHKYVWKDKFNYFKYHKNAGVNLFVGDYKDKPRGRVFYDDEDNTYYIMVGSWIKDYPEAKQVILNEFNLNGCHYSFEIDMHWEIGMGYGE